MTWNDLLELLKTPSAGDTDDPAAPPGSPPDGSNIGILDLVHALLEQYLELQPYEYVAMALWILHTHIYQQFLITRASRSHPRYAAVAKPPCSGYWRF